MIISFAMILRRPPYRISVYLKAVAGTAATVNCKRCAIRNLLSQRKQVKPAGQLKGEVSTF